MTKPDNGGPAFQTNTINVPFSEADNPKYQGMSLRDYFAARAMTVIVQVHADGSINDFSKADVARASYSYADAMLKERSK